MPWGKEKSGETAVVWRGGQSQSFPLTAMQSYSEPSFHGKLKVRTKYFSKAKIN